MLCLDLFNKYKFKLTVSVLGSGCRLAVLHPDSLHPDSLHGDQVCDGGFALWLLVVDRRLKGLSQFTDLIKEKLKF